MKKINNCFLLFNAGYGIEKKNKCKTKYSSSNIQQNTSQFEKIKELKRLPKRKPVIYKSMRIYSEDIKITQGQMNFGENQKNYEEKLNDLFDKVFSSFAKKSCNNKLHTKKSLI